MLTENNIERLRRPLFGSRRPRSSERYFALLGMINSLSRIKSLHQQHGTAALDFAGDFAVEMGRHAGDATGKNFAALGHEFFQQIGVLVIDRFNRDVDPAPRHGAVGTAESRSAFGSFRLHR